MKVLITGGSGFVGRALISNLLKNNSFSIYATYQMNCPKIQNVSWHQTDLLNTSMIAKLIREIKPSYLVHLAWYTKHGKFWNAPENFLWRDASYNLISEFIGCNGKHLMVAGSCAEYLMHDPKYLEQNINVPNYTKAKNDLLSFSKRVCLNEDCKLTWPRIFFPYGPNEDKNKFLSSIINDLKNQKKAICKYPHHNRDYIYIDDLASALATLIGSNFEGEVDIGSGKLTNTGYIAKTIANSLGLNKYLELHDDNQDLDIDFMDISANTKPLNEIGWSPLHSVDMGIKKLIQYI